MSASHQANPNPEPIAEQLKKPQRSLGTKRKRKPANGSESLSPDSSDKLGSEPLDYTGADPSLYTDWALGKKFARHLSSIAIGERVWNDKTREWNKNPNAVSLAIHMLCEDEAKKLNPRFKEDRKQILSLGSARKVQNVESVVKKLYTKKRSGTPIRCCWAFLAGRLLIYARARFGKQGAKITSPSMQPLCQPTKRTVQSLSSS